MGPAPAGGWNKERPYHLWGYWDHASVSAAEIVKFSMFLTDDCDRHPGRKDVQTHGFVLRESWDTKGEEYHMQEGTVQWYSILSLFKGTDDTA